MSKFDKLGIVLFLVGLHFYNPVSENYSVLISSYIVMFAGIIFWFGEDNT